MAEGGVATRATRRLVGEAGPEAIIPLHRIGDVARKIGGGRGGGGIVVNIGNVGSNGMDPDTIGTLVGRAVTAQLRENRGLKAAVRETASGGLFG